MGSLDIRDSFPPTANQAVPIWRAMIQLPNRLVVAVASAAVVDDRFFEARATNWDKTMTWK